jgi:hypothetical protein
MPVEDACMFGEFTRVGETPFPRVCAKSRFGTANPSGKRPFRTDSNSERLVTGVYEWRSPPQLGPPSRFVSSRPTANARRAITMSSPYSGTG